MPDAYREARLADDYRSTTRDAEREWPILRRPRLTADDQRERMLLAAGSAFCHAPEGDE